MFWFYYHRSRKIMWGLFCILLGLFLLLSNHGLLGYSFSLSRDWPIILIAWGIMKIVDILTWSLGNKGRRVNLEAEGEKQSRAQILKDVEEGRLSAEEAANRLRNCRY